MTGPKRLLMYLGLGFLFSGRSIISVVSARAGWDSAIGDIMTRFLLMALFGEFVGWLVLRANKRYEGPRLQPSGVVEYSLGRIRWRVNERRVLG